MGFYSAEADIATFTSDMDMLNAFFVDEGRRMPDLEGEKLTG